MKSTSSAQSPQGLGELEFKAEDGDEPLMQNWRENRPVYISIEKANRILREKLEKLPEVWGVVEHDSYYCHEHSLATHTARLVDIKEIPKCG